MKSFDKFQMITFTHCGFMPQSRNWSEIKKLFRQHVYFYRSNYMAKIFFSPSAVDLMVFIVRKFRSANSMYPDPEFLNRTAFQI
jgi:hypothetical protein